MLDEVAQGRPEKLDRTGPPIIEDTSKEMVQNRFCYLHELLYFVVAEANKEGRCTAFSSLAEAFSVEGRILSRALDYCGGIIGSRYVKDGRTKTTRRELFPALRPRDENAYNEAYTRIRGVVDKVVQRLPERSPQFCFNTAIVRLGEYVRYMN